MEDLIGTVVNALIAGMFTILCTLITIRNQNKREEKKERKKKYANKPELSVNKYNPKNEEEIDMKLLVAKFKVDKDINFEYSDKYQNKEEYIFRDFIFKNIGKTAIESFDIVSTYKKSVSIFDIDCADIFIGMKTINYGCVWDKKIFPEGELKVRLYFHKDIIVASGFSSAFVIQFHDSNGMYWEQPFFENVCNLYSPSEISYREYKDNISVEKAMECFEKPYLW